MNTIDLSPLYRTSIGFDRLASILDNAFSADSVGSNFPPYNIEMIDDSRYCLSLAVAGFDQSELDISIENGVLSVSGRKSKESERHYLHQGIANRSFERKFNLAEHVEVTDAELSNGLLTLRLKKEVPEAMKPRKITISSDTKAISSEEDSTELNKDKAQHFQQAKKDERQDSQVA